MSSEKADERRVGCFLAGPRRSDKKSGNCLAGLLNDFDPRVVDAAKWALQEQRRQFWTSELVESLIQEKSVERQWTLLECLLRTANPTLSRHPLGFMSRIKARLSPAMLNYASDELTELSKKEVEAVTKHFDDR